MIQTQWDLLEIIGIPKRIISFLNETNPDITELYEDKTPESAYIYGPPGIGKSVKAAKLLTREFFRKTYIPANFTEIDPEFTISSNRFLFSSVPDLLQGIKGTFDHPTLKYHQKTITDQFIHADLLVLDDMGIEITSDWAYQILYLIVSGRYNAMLPTIFTSNLSLDELGERLSDERLVSRIIEMCGSEGIIEITGPDHRLNLLKK